MLNKTLINIFRGIFLAVFLVEIFRWKVLNSSINFSWQGLTLTLIFAFILLETAIRWLEKKFSASLSWTSYAAATVSLVLDAVGDMFHYYNRFSPWYDKALHFIGGAVAAIIIYDVLRIVCSARPGSFSRFWMIFLVIGIGMFFSFAYEWFEYIEDVVYWKRPVRLGDAYDTVDDMQLNLLGIILGTALKRATDKRSGVDLKG